MNIRSHSIALLCALTSGALTGCGSKEEQKTATQVAARVNGDEITVHQINNVLARSSGLSPEKVPDAKRQILDRLIDQQIARQQAVKKKLDRTPQVVQAIEAAKTDILARSYLEQVASAQPKPTQEEVKKYYADHPELFAQRRVFHVEEIVARNEAGLAAAMREQAQKTRSLQAVAAWLRSRNTPFGQNERFIASEEIPLNAVAKIHATKEGEIQVNETSDTVSAYRIVSSRAAPVDETTAAPRIQQFLYTQRANEAVAKEMKQLKEHAKVEYVGDFEDKAAEATPKAAPDPRAAESAEAANFEKGIRGLK